MGKFIVKMHDHYLEWSTITDSPVTFGMLFDEFVAYYRDMYGLNGLLDLEDRLKRVGEHGSSAYEEGYWPPDLFRGNRAGPDETELSEEEIYKSYCLCQPIRDGWMVPCADEEEVVRFWATGVGQDVLRREGEGVVEA